MRWMVAGFLAAVCWNVGHHRGQRYMVDRLGLLLKAGYRLRVSTEGEIIGYKAVGRSPEPVERPLRPRS